MLFALAFDFEPTLDQIVDPRSTDGVSWSGTQAGDFPQEPPFHPNSAPDVILLEWDWATFGRENSFTHSSTHH